MCRFVAYIGNPVKIDELVVKPNNSLINQSIKARESEITLNGDGFGIGWYAPDISSEPALFTSVHPAWNDRNLNYLAAKVRTNCLLAHVRAATEGIVSEANCHPFHYKNLLFMHNGGLGGFNVIKRYMRRGLSDDVYEWLKGQTDSEHLFALVIEILNKKNLPEFTAETLADCLMEAIALTEKMKTEHGVSEDSWINAVFTDGRAMVAVRYVTNLQEEPSSLHYSEGNKYECKDGVCEMRPSGPEDHAVIISSETLTDKAADWKSIPANHLLLVNENLNTSLRKCKI